MKSLLVISMFTICGHLLAQSMGLSSTISMQGANSGQAAPRLLTMDMQQFSSKLRAARTYIDQGNYDEALLHLKAAAKIKQTGKLYEYFGDAYTANREAPKAIVAYKKAYKLYKQEKNMKALENIKNTLRFYRVKGF